MFETKKDIMRRNKFIDLVIIYTAAKKYGIAYNTLKDFVRRYMSKIDRRGKE